MSIRKLLGHPYVLPGAKENIKFSQFPGSRAQPAGDRNIFIEPKNCRWPSENIYSYIIDMSGLIVLEYFEYSIGKGKSKTDNGTQLSATTDLP